MRPEERWGWVSMPFRRETEPTGWVETAKQKEALARLHVMVELDNPNYAREFVYGSMRRFGNESDLVTILED